MKGRIGFSWIVAGAAALLPCAIGSCAAPKRDDFGGEGGAGAGDPAAGGAPSAACDVDCAAVVPPPCFLSVCDAPSRKCEIVPLPRGAPCDDGAFCTIGDSCSDGACIPGAKNDCGKKPATCAAVRCDEPTKSCHEEPALDGVACVSADPCTSHASCKAGACVGEPKDCLFAPVPDDCHAAVCNPGTGKCEPVPANEGSSCERGGDPCLSGKTCVSGVCQGGSPKDCSSVADACNAATCEAATGACEKVPLASGGACTEAADECNAGACDAAGVCQKVPMPGGPCFSAENDCNAGVCDVSGKCVAFAKNEGKSCDDGNACTAGETCAKGICGGGKSEGYVESMRETFADAHAAGWTTEGEWQLGPAKASPGVASMGHEDPASDHTASMDGGLAGIVIGGYPATTKHAPVYLTSPPVDVHGGGDVWLSFWRFLNSDYGPYMTNTIDVFDGSTWVNVWTSGGARAIHDEGWTLVKYDLSSHKNAAMRVRFGFEVGSGGAFRVAGWSLDDVVLSNAVCDVAR